MSRYRDKVREQAEYVMLFAAKKINLLFYLFSI